MSGRIALVSCGKAKQAEGMHPLRELYTGPLFRAARRDVESRALSWFIVSALLSCRRPTYEAAPYDLTIRHPNWKDANRRRWGERCVSQLGQMARLRGATVELHMGSDYARWLRGPLVAAGAELEVPVSGQIGQRLAEYKRRRLVLERLGGAL
jgi:hypothetical protein